MERYGEELEDRLLEFAARIGKLVDALPDTRLGRHIAGQLVRSGTSPAPNYTVATLQCPVSDRFSGLIAERGWTRQNGSAIVLSDPRGVARLVSSRVPQAQETGLRRSTARRPSICQWTRQHSFLRPGNSIRNERVIRVIPQAKPHGCHPNF